MKTPKPEEIARFLKSNIEPLEDVYGTGYRASAYLLDGTYLPCVAFRNPKDMTDLAIRQFKEEQSKKRLFRKRESCYRTIVQHFVTVGNRVNGHEIARVKKANLLFLVPFWNRSRAKRKWAGQALSRA